MPGNLKENNLSDLTNIITSLEQQRATIDRALLALREIGGPPPPRRGRPRKDATVVVAATTEGGPRKRVLSPEGRARIIEATKKRWAAKRAAERTAPTKGPTKKRGMTTAGRKRLSEMMKARWASKNPPRKRAA